MNLILSAIEENYEGATISLSFPWSLPHDNLSNHSIITIIEYAGIKVIISGDNEILSINELMTSEKFKVTIKNCDVLLAPFHGSESGYHTEFVKLANPRLAIVSGGLADEENAIQKYSANSRGWEVFKFDGTSEVRNSLATNRDGEIYVKFGYNAVFQDKKFLNVKIR